MRSITSRAVKPALACAYAEPAAALSRNVLLDDSIASPRIFVLHQIAAVLCRLLRMRALESWFQVGKRARQIRRAEAVRAPAVAAPARSRTDLYISLTLFVVTLAVYSRAVYFDFINFDDPDYVTNNPHVRAGLTWDGFVWAFTTFHAANWSPLTWLSHMADCQVFGVSSWHHATSVLFHATAAVLLFLALNRLTAARWPSAFVAFLFALHPLHVESVAWVSERKDVVCAFFWFLTLLFYARYVERPGKVRYLQVLAAFCLGLMAKPMIVTLPFVLLLLDAWPLRRLNLAAVREKLPFFAASLASCVVTYLAQQSGHAVRSLAAVGFGTRLANAVVAYAVYLTRMFWPTNLAVYYPYPTHLPVWQVAGSVIALASITWFAIHQRHSRPWLAIGWFWYIGTLVPVIGLIQVGSQASADRYTYVPMIGIAIMVAWSAAELVRLHPRAAGPVRNTGVATCCVCVFLTVFQLAVWQNSQFLYLHALAVTSDNAVAHNNLADFYLVNQRNQDALPHIQEALRIKPDYPDAHTNLALVLKRSGNLADSERGYRESLTLQPASSDAHAGYGALLVAEGRLPEAAREFSAAIALRPDYADAHFDLGRVLAALGRQDEALAQYNEAIRLRPDNTDARHALGFALVSRGRMAEALVQFRAEARLRPNDAGIHYTVGSLLASSGHFPEAIAEFTEALHLRPNFPAAQRALQSVQAQQQKAPERKTTW
jgi:tetratricopeptide (TPR) repeat protein